MSAPQWGNDWRDWAGFFIALLAFIIFGTAIMVAIGWAMFSTIPANAQPTYQQACATPQGNPDGTYCTWTEPNGKQYLVTSDEYRRGPEWGAF